MNFDRRTEKMIGDLLVNYADGKIINHVDVHNQPDRKAVIELVDKLMRILYPGYYSDCAIRQYSLRHSIAATIEDVIFDLRNQLETVYQYCDMPVDSVEDITFAFMEKLPGIRDTLETDLDAFYEGDPAAYSKAEVLMSYPGLIAISIYRMAHELYLLGVPMLPRFMSEYAHSKTGIDIHPGATIGKWFFIDHGTGIVIGETTEIGEHVKIYQGVTLGGLSTRGGQAMKGSKRHPTIGNNVTIYSGASILGGQTVIGDDVTIGGNAFVTESVTKGKKVVI